MDMEIDIDEKEQIGKQSIGPQEIVVVQQIESQQQSQSQSDNGNIISKAVPTLCYVVFETILTIVLVAITLNSDVSKVFVDIETETYHDCRNSFYLDYYDEYYYDEWTDEKYGYDEYNDEEYIVIVDYTIQMFFWIIFAVTVITYLGVQLLQTLCLKRVAGLIFMLSYAVFMCGIASVSQALNIDITAITNGIIIVAVSLAFHLFTEKCRPEDLYLFSIWLPLYTGIIIKWDYLCYEVIMYGCIHSVHTFYHVKAIRFVDVECSFLESLKIFGILAQLSKEILLYTIYQPYDYAKSFKTRVIVYLNKADAKQKVQYLVITYSIVVISIWYFLLQWYLGYATSKFSDYIDQIYFPEEQDALGFEFTLTTFGIVCLIVPFVLHFIVMLFALNQSNLQLKILTTVLGFVEIIFIGLFTSVIASIQLVAYYFYIEENYSTEYFLGFCMIIFLSLISHILSGQSIDNIELLLLFWITIPLLLILHCSHSENYYSVSMSTVFALPYTYYAYGQSKYILNSSDTGIAINDYLIGALSLMNPPAQIIVNILVRCYRSHKQRNNIESQQPI